ncbi:MAG: UvrD-helicase domain-containing protein [Sphingobacteriaceae bacterium]|nr:UvrD-helicase domain-containing protein [Sphingobacteriaceae bacterium]
MKNFLVYKSGAGSGKTFTLVKEFLRLAMLDEKKINYNFKRILAVTFTNKAAAEMKERVIHYLTEISKNAILPDIGQSLLIDLNIKEEQLRERAKLLLTQIIHNYSELSIGTIDSFTHKIVKTFAYELDLPINFNIETDLTSFYNQIISNLFATVGEDKNVTALLKEYALAKADDNASWDPERSLKQFVKLLGKENASEFIEKLNTLSDDELNSINQQIKTAIGAFRKNIKEMAITGQQIIKTNNLTVNDLKGKSKSPLNIFEKCLKGKESESDFQQKTLLEAIETGKWLIQTGKLNDQFTQTVVELRTYYLQNCTGYQLNILLHKHMHLIRLIKKIEELSSAKKEEEQIVFISEFNQKIFELIKNEPTPFIYERLGEKYHHYLLDEFQDTSSLQWQNILPLLDHSLASGYYNLVVGDGKQSIYRWRNANVKQFIDLPGKIKGNENKTEKERLDSLSRNYQVAFLDTNRRSTSTIVEFNNNLFSDLSENLGGEDTKSIYYKQSQITHSNETGLVQIHSGVLASAEHKEINLKQVLENVRAALADGFQPKDICIITRKKETGSWVAQVLSENQIPVVSSESLLLKNNRQVNVLTSFLSYLIDKSDKISAGVVLQYLFDEQIIDANTLFLSYEDLAKSKDLFKVLNKIGIQFQEEKLELSNLLDLCIYINELLQLSKDNSIYIRFFLDQVTEFTINGKNSLSAFLTWWEVRQKKASVIIPESSNAVKIMTIHAAKGLEFPVVIIPFCNWRIHEQDDVWVDLSHTNSKLPVSILQVNTQMEAAGLSAAFEHEIQEEILDNLNLLYVAFTRAIHRLHILAYRKEKVNHKSVDQWLSQFLFKDEKLTDLNISTFGQSLKYNSKKKANLPEFKLNNIRFNADSKTIQIKSSTGGDFLYEKDFIQYGIAIHEILSNIQSIEAIETEVQLAVTKGLISAKDQNSIITKITSIINHPDLIEYYNTPFTNKVEKEILSENGEILRPDKIVINNKSAVIIDYKSGYSKAEIHREQMNNYEKALLKMGFQEIKKLIAFVDTGQVIRLD